MLAALAISSSATADHGLVDHISAGANGNFDANFAGSSQDGTRAFFQTAESMTAGDTDGSRIDVYERSSGATTLVSTGPSGGSGAFDAHFNGTSTDGDRVFFTTAERLVPSDTDNQQDVYERSGGATTLVSTGPTGGNGAFDTSYAGASQDGTRVFFTTSERLVPSDTDNQQDVYERSGGTTTLVSTGPTGGNGSFFANYAGASQDGTRVFFTTNESLVPSDTDNQQDVYERSGGTTTLVSTGPTGGNGAFDAGLAGTSADGTHVFFRTAERLVGADTDFTFDVYDRFGGTTSLISIGALGGNANINAFYAGASQDGTHVFITTSEALESTDFDGSIDIYDRTGGTTTLISQPPVSGGQANVTFDGASADGAHVFYDTAERDTTDDDNNLNDVYERFAGTTTRVSKGPLSGGTLCCVGASFSGASDDGTRVFFTTSDSLVAKDTGDSNGNPDPDVYERFAGETYLVSTGQGVGADNARFDGNTPNGTHVFFHTTSNLTGSDADGNLDVYAAIVNYVRPRGATPLRVPLVPAFAECTSPDSSHGSPLSFGSCAPPVQASPNVTIGTPDANGAATNSIGTIVLKVRAGNPAPPDDSDVTIDASLTDVRCQAGVATCGPANAAGGADYTGELRGETSVRITDSLNGVALTDPGTMTDTPVPFTLSCASTASTDEGGTCAATTSVNALTPGAVKDGKRSIWQLGQVRVLDGGTDGAAATAPNAVLAVQGLFVP